MRVRFLTLGCPKNEVDTDRMRHALAVSAFEEAPALDDADVVVLNTCAFIQEAVEESIASVLELAEWKAAGPGRALVVAGCMPSRYGTELAAELPEVDAFVPVAEESSLPAVLDGLRAERRAARPRRPRERATSIAPSSYLMVSDGCFRECSFCTIPAIRGPYRSRPLPELVREAHALLSRGARELVLVGQDVSAYGRDLADDADLPALVRALGSLEGLDWLRIMYVQPDGVTDALLEAMAETPAVCRYLDIPLQHASRTVLRRMARTGGAEDFLVMLARVRAALPDVVLRTTLIAGFPGETDSDVALLEDFLRQADLDYVGVFAFSPEDGTPAVGMSPRPSESVRLERAQRLRDVADSIGFERAASRVGATVAVLVEGVDEDGVPVGRWSGQAPEVDGVVSLDAPLPAGSLVGAFIVDALGYDLVGEVTSCESR